MILVSGGRSSARMAYHVHNSDQYSKYEKVFVFCNTGQERPETIQFLKDQMSYWGIPLICLEGVYSQEPGVGVSHKIVDIENLNMKGEPLSGAIMQMNKHKWTGVFCPPTPYCSDYTKTRVSQSFARTLWGRNPKYIKAIGYRAEDMPKRITFKELKEEHRLYYQTGRTVMRIAPLLQDFDRPVTKGDLTIFFNDQPFQLQINSDIGNCELCFKKSDKNLIKAINTGTRFIDWHDRHEREYGNFFFRGNRSIHEIVEMAEKAAKNPTQLDMFPEEEAWSCVCQF